MREFPEADWRLLRKLREDALERFCERILDQLVRTASDTGKSFHDRYLSIWRLLKKHDKQLAAAFDDPRRSQAFEQLTLMYSFKLIKDQELLRFSLETQEVVKMLMGLAP